MKNTLPRRSFLKRSALAAGALTATPFLSFPNLLRAQNVGRKLNCAVIGCGSRGMAHLGGAVNENIVAIVDPIESRYDVVNKWMASKQPGAKPPRTFTDYRQLFDKMGKEIDAIFIASPNHQHALPALMAMKAGINVYCEKPLCHDIAEARALRQASLEARVATQMGNQGHCMDGYRRLCEYLWAGVIGNVLETHSWTDRSNGGRGPRPKPEPVPAGIHWDEWLGPAPFRDYHADLQPHEWHGWYDFGNGSLGNMGCHTLDGVFWALKVGHPVSLEAELVNGGSDERYPVGTRIRYDIPAREGMPAFKAYWYDGRDGANDQGDHNKASQGKHEKGGRIYPKLATELLAKHADEEFEGSGTLYVGDKGIIYTGTYGSRMHIIPWEKMKATKAPDKTLTRPQDVITDFLEACRAGSKKTEASFEYGARLTEFVLLGNLAQHAGAGKKVLWDGPKMEVTNLRELNAWIKRPYRAGWKA